MDVCVRVCVGVVERRQEGTRGVGLVRMAARISRNSARNRQRNRCKVTGRSRGYYRKLKLSRIALRDLASVGQIPGMVKSSW